MIHTNEKLNDFYKFLDESLKPITEIEYHKFESKLFRLIRSEFDRLETTKQESEELIELAKFYGLDIWFPESIREMETDLESEFNNVF